MKLKRADEAWEDAEMLSAAGTKTVALAQPHILHFPPNLSRDYKVSCGRCDITSDIILWPLRPMSEQD